MASPNQTLTQSQKDTLINNLKIRFEKNPDRHQLISWENIVQKLNAAPLELWSLNEMERTDGEPDVVHYDAVTDEYICSLTALQKAQKAEEASATTEKRSTPEKNINLQIAQ